MKIVHLRFETLLTSLAHMRHQRERFQRLLYERPTGIRVQTRAKNPAADLKLTYRTDMATASAATALFFLAGAVGLPSLDVTSAQQRRDQIVIQMEDVPETRQIVRPPPPPRPAVPIEVYDESVPDDVTIESTDLDFDNLDLPPPPPPGVDAPPGEEIVEFWKVEVKPEVIRQSAPEYPEVARRAGLEGTVHCRLLVGRDGKVKRVEVLKGDDVFANAVVKAAYAYQFTPAMQNDRAVQVWMVIPMNFRLVR